MMTPVMPEPLSMPIPHIQFLQTYDYEICTNMVSGDEQQDRLHGWIGDMCTLTII